MLQAMCSGLNELAGEKLSLRLAWLENISQSDRPPFGIVSQDALKLLQEQEELPALYKELQDFFGRRLHLCQRRKGVFFAF
jgi:hypothetical protein